MAEPCRCDGPNRECRRMGLPMVGNRHTLCHGDEPYTAEQSDAAREEWDAHARHDPPATTDSVPGILRRLANFSVALTKHVAGGMQMRSEEMIARLLENHCLKCEKYRDGICTHQNCGCHVGKERKFFNKLAWFDQHCPLGRW